MVPSSIWVHDSVPVTAVTSACSVDWASCATTGTPPSARHTKMTAVAAHSLRMIVPPSCAGRVRQWLDAVPAAKAWATCHRLPLTRYDATPCHGVQESEVVKAVARREEGGLLP